jgi:hypothetical protein
MRERVFSPICENVSEESHGRDIGCVMREQRPALLGLTSARNHYKAMILIFCEYCVLL